MADRIRAILVGCGGITEAWLNGATRNPDLEIVGLVDLSIEAAGKRKEQHRLKEAVTSTDLESILKQLKPDAVFYATTPGSHVKVALTALEHGHHVLGEKPLADTMENARKMVEAARRTGRIHAVIQNGRYDARIRGFKEFVASGVIGDLNRRDTKHARQKGTTEDRGSQ